MLRKCCGYYCAMVAAVGIFFFAVIIVMEVRRNPFVLWKMQYPEEAEHYHNETADTVRVLMNEKADNKIVPLIVVIGVSPISLFNNIAEPPMRDRMPVSSQATREEGGRSCQSSGEKRGKC
jgi:hypothetical protein